MALEERIVAFATEELGMRPGRIGLSSRLSHDLGMDGDDAVQFFERFGEDFKVDLTVLYDHWREHFGGEGMSLEAMLVIGAAVGLGIILHEAFQPIPWWIWMIVLLCAFHFGYYRRFKVVPVTVSDLVDAAKEGRWVKPYR